MNERNDLHYRLLKLFPVKFIKSLFDMETQSQDEMIDSIIEGYTPDSIFELALDNINHTKQHIRIYKLDSNFNPNNFDSDDFPLHIYYTSRVGGQFVIYCCPRVRYSVGLLNPYEEQEIVFFQPVKITLRRDILIIQSTILEKKLDSYFEGNRRVVELGKTGGEEDFIDEILSFFRETHDVDVCDLNRGVKHLWNNNVFDSTSVRFKKNRSTSTEVMDEDYTVKTQYPDVYTSLMASPLNKTTLKYLPNDGVMCKHFLTNPSSGEISITLYPENDNQIDNVINQILANN